MPVIDEHNTRCRGWVASVLVLLLGLMPLTAWAQEQPRADAPVDDVDTTMQDIMLDEQLSMFLNEAADLSAASQIRGKMTDYSTLSDYYVQVLHSQWQEVSTDFQFFDFRWNTFVQAHQDEIAEDTDLASQLAEVRQYMQNARDTLELRKTQLQAMADFLAAERMVTGKDSIYKRLYRTAFGLSLVKKAAPKLESCKAQEQLLFQKLEAAYGKAKTAAAMVPGLESRMAVIDENFSRVKGVSTQIQAMTYKPFIQRVKDYLIGLACVVILLMFANMVQSKIKAAKQMRDSMKQYRDLMDRNNMGDYPTI